MKTVILTTIILFASVLFSNAQNPAEKNNLTGVWQQYIPASRITEDQQTGQLNLDTATMRPGVHYKFFMEDGHFISLFATQVVSKIIITGTYEVLSPGVYVEHVEEHMSPAYAHQDIELEYQFLTDDVFVMSYMNGFGNKVFEIWKEVKFGNPAEELAKLRQKAQNEN